MNENETKKVKCLQNEHFLKGRDILPMTNKLTFKLAYYIISTYQYGAPSTLLKMEYKNMSQYSQLHMTTGSWKMWDLKRVTVQKRQRNPDAMSSNCSNYFATSWKCHLSHFKMAWYHTRNCHMQYLMQILQVSRSIQTAAGDYRWRRRKYLSQHNVHQYVCMPTHVII